MAIPQTFTTPAPQTNDVKSGLLAQATSATRPSLTSDETMYGQMQNIVAEDSPWLQMAKTSAKQAMNDRGLLNSSMAVGAAQQAAYQAAMPIAQFDANAKKSVGDMQFQANQQTNLQNATQGNAMEQFNAEAANKATLANMDTATKLALADVEANYKTLMQADAEAGKLYTTVLNNITDINSNSTMDATAKTAAIDAQKQLLKSGFTIIEAMNNLEGLSELLTFGSTSTSETQP